MKQESSFTFQSTSSQRGSADSDNTVDTLTAGKIHAGTTASKDDGEDLPNGESKGANSREASDKSALKTAASDDIEDALVDSSSFSDTTQETMALSAASLDVETTDAPSSLLKYGYVILCSCAVIVVLTLAYLYRRVFQRGRQPYMNINSLDSTIGVAVSSTDDEYEVDETESTDAGGPRISRHAQSSQSVM